MLKIWHTLRYLDELVECVDAVSEYAILKDERRLADRLTGLGLRIAQEATGGDPHHQIDEEKLRQALVQAIDAIGPAFD